MNISKLIIKLSIIISALTVLGCSDDCTKQAIKKLPFIEDRPECDTYFMQDLILQEDAIYTGNLRVNGLVDLNGHRLDVSGFFYAEEVIVSDTLNADWGLKVGRMNLQDGVIETSFGVEAEILFGTGEIGWCTDLSIDVNNSQGVNYVNTCPEPFDDKAQVVNIPCEKELPYAENIDGIIWIFVDIND